MKACPRDVEWLTVVYMHIQNVRVRVLQGGMCTVYIPAEDKVVSVSAEHLEPTLPSKGDKVRTSRRMRLRTRVTPLHKRHWRWR